MRVITLTVIAIAAAGMAGAGDGLFGKETVLINFDEAGIPSFLAKNNVEVRLAPRDGSQALEVDFQVVDWPNAFFTAPEGVWDWSAYTGIAVDVFNPEDRAINVCMRVDNDGADGMNYCVTAATTAQPGEWTTLRASFRTGAFDVFWGMRGLPVLGPVTRGAKMDPSRIVAFQVFLSRPSESHTLYLDSIRLFGQLSAPLEELVGLPFIDPFGQYKHADWPGKLHDETDFATRLEAEQAALEQAPELPGRDQYGGWADGPQLEATGWFRTARVDGEWWLVTPSGHLFFSTGMDCVGTWGQTFIEKREPWFDWLPQADSPLAGFLGHQRGAHSGADPIGGEGRTFSFYRANLMRKYGDSWPEMWRATTYDRLQAWGFNTIANWSQGDVLDNSPVPFVASANVSGGFRRIEAGGGYWSKMADVFDPAFAEAAERCIAPVAQRYANNPLCLGYFVDNELSWGGVRRGVLTSPPDQPCRQAFVEQLKGKHGSLETVNEAWDTQAVSWDDLTPPAHPNPAHTADLDAFEYAFAKRYFEIVQGVLRKHAPNQLNLGCRFSVAPPLAIRAAADVIDVVSFNRYEEQIQPEKWTGENDLGKPLIIGEFHFGALDRGMFHTGLVGAKDQADRAAKYARYVESVADCPAFVGCHWFQYIDEPTTGRWFDGENYNIGFVTVVDSPYREMVEAAKRVHAAVYQRRHGPQ